MTIDVFLGHALVVSHSKPRIRCDRRKNAKCAKPHAPLTTPNTRPPSQRGSPRFAHRASRLCRALPPGTRSPPRRPQRRSTAKARQVGVPPGRTVKWDPKKSKRNTKPQVEWGGLGSPSGSRKPCVFLLCFFRVTWPFFRKGGHS